MFGAFSWCLLVGGLVSAPVGMLLDRFGGRFVMGAGSLCCGLGFIFLSQARDVPTWYLAWTLLGMSMAATLYEAAFATINHQYGLSARKAISTLTLFGGFASTVFWPLTLKLNTLLGWRDTYLLYAGLQLCLCLPLHLMLSGSAPRACRTPRAARASAPTSRCKQALRHPAFWTLAFAFSANSFIFSALSVHLIPILQRFGHPIATVVFMAALIGPMQVAGRIAEMDHRPQPGAAERRQDHLRAAAGRAAGAAVLRRRAMGDGAVLHPVRPVQRHPDHRARHRAAGHVRQQELRRHFGRDGRPVDAVESGRPAGGGRHHPVQPVAGPAVRRTVRLCRRLAAVLPDGGTHHAAPGPRCPQPQPDKEYRL